MPDESLIYVGGPVKALDQPGLVGGYLITFGDKDLVDETFTAETYYGAQKGNGADCFFNHMKPLKGVSTLLTDHIFAPIKTRQDEIGIFAETVLNLADEYEAMVKELIDAGKLRWSSGSASHTIRRDPDGVIKRWPIIEGSFTPEAAEYRNRILSLKSYQAILDAAPHFSAEAARLYRDHLQFIATLLPAHF